MNIIFIQFANLSRIISMLFLEYVCPIGSSKSSTKNYSSRSNYYLILLLIFTLTTPFGFKFCEFSNQGPPYTLIRISAIFGGGLTLKVICPLTPNTNFILMGVQLFASFAVPN